MRLIDQLKEEHKAIKQLLELLQQTCDTLQSSGSVDLFQLDQIMTFIRVFADQRHHCKEEELLFPAIILAKIPNTENLLEEILQEHEKGREFVRNMNRVKYHVLSDPRFSAFFIENANDYLHLLKEHMQKEEKILYPLANLGFSKVQERHLLDRFDVIEDEMFGLGKIEELHEILNELSG